MNATKLRELPDELIVILRAKEARARRPPRCDGAYVRDSDVATLRETWRVLAVIAAHADEFVAWFDGVTERA